MDPQLRSTTWWSFLPCLLHHRIVAIVVPLTHRKMCFLLIRLSNTKIKTGREREGEKEKRRFNRHEISTAQLFIGERLITVWLYYMCGSTIIQRYTSTTQLEVAACAAVADGVHLTPWAPEICRLFLLPAGIHHMSSLLRLFDYSSLALCHVIDIRPSRCRGREQRSGHKRT